MKTLCFAIALTIAVPALAVAQTKPTAPDTPEHGSHGQLIEHDNCDKMQPGAKKDCCEKHAKDKAADDAHMGHEGMQH